MRAAQQIVARHRRRLPRRASYAMSHRGGAGHTRRARVQSPATHGCLHRSRTCRGRRLSGSFSSSLASGAPAGVRTVIAYDSAAFASYLGADLPRQSRAVCERPRAAAVTRPAGERGWTAAGATVRDDDALERTFPGTTAGASGIDSVMRLRASIGSRPVIQKN
jgi:hypothetical protein